MAAIADRGAHGALYEAMNRLLPGGNTVFFCEIPPMVRAGTTAEKIFELIDYLTRYPLAAANLAARGWRRQGGNMTGLSLELPLI